MRYAIVKRNSKTVVIPVDELLAGESPLTVVEAERLNIQDLQKIVDQIAFKDRIYDEDMNEGEDLILKLERANPDFYHPDLDSCNIERIKGPAEY